MLTITLPEPHQAQKEVLKNRKRFNTLKCGRRWGKTEVCQILTSEIIGIRGITGYWCPVHKDFAEVWSAFKEVFHPIITRKNEVLNQLEFIGGSKMDFWSMDDPNSGRGRKYHRAIIDECEKAIKFQEAWEQTIRPTLIDYRGDAYLLSTPKFGDTFFKKLCKYGLKYPNWANFCYSSHTNPHLSQAELEELTADMHPSVYDCEILALDVDGKVLHPFAFQFDPVYHVSDQAIFQPSKQLVISIDFNIQPFAVQFSNTWTDGTGQHDHTFDEAEIDQGSIPKMAELIQQRYGRYLALCHITGDAMGRNRDISQRDNSSLYAQLIKLLHLRPDQLRIPKSGNPTHINSKADCNYLLWQATRPGSGIDIKFHPSCKGSIRDMQGVQWDDLKSQIMKQKREQETQRADLLDCSRYRWNVYFRTYLDRNRV